MSVRSRLRRALAPQLKQYPRLWKGAVAADFGMERLRHSTARTLPVLIRPEPRSIEIAITARCNLACIGCRYGRDFMPGSQLPYAVVRDLLDDARDLGIWDIRLYGGEPLLHRDLPRMVEYAGGLGLQTHVTTNGMLLRQKLDGLWAAGLRNLTIGFYGTGATYDAYVQRRARFDMLEAGVRSAREKYGSELNMRVNWLLKRPTCTVDDLRTAVDFARRYDLRMQIDLVHYSLPYFTEGPDRMLQFRPEDRPAIEVVVEELLRLKEEEPDRLQHSLEGLRSIPDWLMLGPDMQVPCDAYQMLWVGADGSVQLCYVTFPLGNLHEHRLRDLLFTPAHRAAARGAYDLKCGNCHCHYDRRVRKDVATAARYSGQDGPGPGHRNGSSPAR
jgi:cyclic pyranopterin phosphate synthase